MLLDFACGRRTLCESVAGVFARGGMGVGFKCVRFSEREKEREKMGKGNYGVLATRKPTPCQL
jgi:hypothetical protein